MGTRGPQGQGQAHPRLQRVRPGCGAGVCSVPSSEVTFLFLPQVSPTRPKAILMLW